MSCEIRSMMTSYFFGSSIRMPPIFTNSAVTPSAFTELIFSTNAGGNVFSIPKRIPIFLSAINLSPRQTKISTHVGTDAFVRPLGEARPVLTTSDQRPVPKNTFPPSAATPANHACCYPRRYPTNAQSPYPAESLPASQPHPDPAGKNSARDNRQNCTPSPRFAETSFSTSNTVETH